MNLSNGRNSIFIFHRRREVGKLGLGLIVSGRTKRFITRGQEFISFSFRNGGLDRNFFLPQSKIAHINDAVFVDWGMISFRFELAVNVVRLVSKRKMFPKAFGLIIDLGRIERV